jgi:hypothetical protein
MTESTFLIAVLLWVVCGGVAAFLAQAKGRSPGNWFLVGFFFGPFGVIAAALARPEGSAAYAPATADTSRAVTHPPTRGEFWSGWIVIAIGVALGILVILTQSVIPWG